MGLQIRQKLSSLGPVFAFGAPNPAASWPRLEAPVRWPAVCEAEEDAYVGLACAPDAPKVL